MLRSCLTVFLFLLAAGYSSAARADAEARQGNDWVRITARPCSDPNVLRHIQDAGQQLDFRAASAQFQGKTYSGCWTPISGGVAIVYEDSDQGFIPAGDLKPVPEGLT